LWHGAECLVENLRLAERNRVLCPSRRAEIEWLHTEMDASIVGNRFDASAENFGSSEHDELQIRTFS